MHQLARGTRLGLAQPAHVCTVCYAALNSRPVPATRNSLHSTLQQTSRQYAQQSTESSSPTETAPADEKSSTPPTTDADAGAETKETKQKPPRARKSTKPSVNTFNGPNVGNALGGRKPLKASKAAAKAFAQAKAGLGGAASQTQLKLWRETLEVLKKLETAQGRLAEQAAIATGVAKEEMLSSGDASLEKKGKDGAAPETTGKASKNKKAAPVVHTLAEKQAAVIAAKEAQEQVKMLTSALHLLKTVLSTQGQPQPQEPQSKGNQQEQAQSDQPEVKLGKHAKKKLAKKKAEAEAVAEEAKDKATSAAPPAKKTPAPKKRAIPAAPLIPKEAHKRPYRVSSVDSRELALTPIEENQRPVPKLHYGLDRALFNPGVYHLQDPRSRVFNFDPYLASIMPLQEFDFNALKQYITSSKDPTLISMAAKHKMKYSGSTSSMTSMLSHFHFLLSGWRPINAAHTTRSFTPESMNFTRITRGPAATFLHWKDGTYAIDADKEFDTANILSMLGKSMEKLLTLSKEDFEKYRVTRSHELTEEERNDPESFHYTTFGDFMMRSQLDAYDGRLPGTGMFDLKTRAVVSIRMDAQDFQRGLGYEIRQRFGQWESFEREYFDMIRSAFLKYSLQVRMGRMDGIYVAFHNTQRIFGFQYISVNEMDLALHGSEDTALGDREFKLSLHLLNAVMDKATERFPGRSLRMHIETRPSEAAPFMYIFATPVTAKEIAEVQDASKESVEAFERNILGLTTNENEGNNSLAGSAADDADADAEAEAEAEAAEARDRWESDEYDLDDSYSVDVWETMRQKVEETMENEAQGIESVRDTIEDALEQSGLLRGRSPEETRAYVDALLEAITRTDTEAVAETILKGQDNDADADAEAEAEAEAESAAETDVAAEKQAETKAESETDVETSPSTSESDINAEAAGAENKTDDEAVSTEEDADEALSATSEEETTVSTYDLSQSVIDEDGDSNLSGDESSARSNTTTETPAPTSSQGSPSGTLSLKDLIIKLASKVEAAQARDAAANSTATAAASATTTSGSSDGQQADTKDKDSEDGSPVLFNHNSSIAELVDAPKNKRFERILSVMMASSKEGKVSTKAAASPSSPPAPETPETPEIIGMIMTIRNKVNGRYVVRPEKLTNSDSWKVEYAIEEIETKRAHTLYTMLKTRRKALLSRGDKDDKDDKDGESGGEVEGLGEYVGEAPKKKKSNAQSAFNRDFMNKLYALSAKGRRYRENENLIMSKRPLHVYGSDGSMEWRDVFADDLNNKGELKRARVEEKRKAKKTV